MTAKKNRTPDQMEYYAVRLSPDTISKLTRLAAKDSRTTSAYVRLVLERHVAEYRAKKIE